MAYVCIGKVDVILVELRVHLAVDEEGTSETGLAITGLL